MTLPSLEAPLSDRADTSTPAGRQRAGVEASFPLASFKERPDHFVVEEIPAYPPSGEGDHLFVTFRKTGLTTNDAVDRIAGALGVSARDAGVAGIKDKVAVTTQTASFFVPRGAAVDSLLSGVEDPTLAILASARHPHKLKPGHLTGNRFRIWLGGLVRTKDRAAIAAGLNDARARGVPNFYGAQRFGFAGGNAERALKVVRGEAKPPRDKRQFRFLFSALQSALFNRSLVRRIEDETWSTIVAGDLAKKHDTGGMFAVPTGDEAQLDEARQRAAALAISATGPMFGASMRNPEGRAKQIEDEVLAEAGLSASDLARFRHAGEGTRRSLRLLCDELTWTEAADGLLVEFVLPKGGYATTLLENVCRLGKCAPAAETPPDEPLD